MNERCLELQDKSRGSTASTAGTASDDGSGEDVKPTRAATGAERKSKKGKTACSFHNHDIESMVADLSIVRVCYFSYDINLIMDVPDA